LRAFDADAGTTVFQRVHYHDLTLTVDPMTA
jgi:hypothetical protein